MGQIDPKCRIQRSLYFTRNEWDSLKSEARVVSNLLRGDNKGVRKVTVSQLIRLKLFYAEHFFAVFKKIDEGVLE